MEETFEDWIIGEVITMNPSERKGLIKPEHYLPFPFLHSKHVLFNFSNIEGPRLEPNDIVHFQLNINSEVARPNVSIVKQLGWLKPDALPQQKNRSRSRTRNSPQLQNESHRQSQHRPEKQNGSHSQSQNRQNLKMTLMEVDSSSQVTIDSELGDTLNMKKIDEQWLLGSVVGYNEDREHGFIRPEESLPSIYKQNKDVFFRFSDNRGPPIAMGSFVDFQLNTRRRDHLEKPSARIVKELNYVLPKSNITERRKNSPQQKNRSRSRPRNSPQLQNESHRQSQHRPEQQNRSHSQSRNRQNLKMTLMGVDSSSQETIDSELGDTLNMKEMDEQWLLGSVVGYNEEREHGFIRPEESLPSIYKQNKDVFFRFSDNRGPPIAMGSFVDFRLNTRSRDHLEKPSARIVKELNYVLPNGNITERRKNGQAMDIDRRPNREMGEKEKPLDDSDNQGYQYSPREESKKKGNNEIYSNLSAGNTDKTQSLRGKNQKQDCIKKVSKSDFISRVRGKIVKLLDDKGSGFLNPITPMPEGYPENKDVFFLQQFVENGGILLKENDIIEFTPGTQNKSSPMARSTIVVQFTPRSISTISNYLNELGKLLNDDTHENQMKVSEILCRVIACEAAWTTIGNTNAMPDDLTWLVIKILLAIEKKALSMQHAFKGILEAVTNSHFFDPWSGSLQRLIKSINSQVEVEDDMLSSIKELLLLIVAIIPEKSHAIVTLLKPLISKDRTSTEYFLYQMLRHSAQHCPSSLEDLPWENLPLVPSVEELTCGPLENTSSLKPVKYTGAYESAEEYMDIYFRLLRADCFDNLRKGVRAFLDGKLDTRDMNVYHSINLVGLHLTNQDSGLAIALQIKPLREVKNWATSSSLMFGNLLCLSLSNTFRDPIWATIVSRDVNLLQTKGIIIVELCSENNTMSDSAAISQLSHGSGRTIAVESPTYYRAYQPILKALQKMNPEEFPFYDQLVKMDTTVYHPEYINSKSIVDATILHGSARSQEEYIMDALQPDITNSIMDRSQFSALKNAITNKVGVIQGPPGTGKTYIGIKIVDLILSMSTVPEAPIVVLTYKNHALDEFLKAIIAKYPESVARVGGRCKEPEIEMCNLSELRKNHKKSQAIGKLFSQLYAESDELRPLVKKCAKELDEACTFSNQTLIEFGTPNQITSLLLGCNWLKSKIQVPTENGKIYLTKNDVKGNLDIIATSDMVINDFVNHPHSNDQYRVIAGNVLSLIDTAMKQWYPNSTEVKQVEETLGTYSSIDLDAVSLEGVDDTPVLENQDEKDIEDMEKERMASVSRKVMKDADIIEFKSSIKSQSTPCLFSTAKHVVNKIPMAKLMNCTNLWDLASSEKVKYIQCLLIRQIESPQLEFENAVSKYQQVCSRKNELDMQHSLSLLQSKKVIGMTITGASIHQDLLLAIQPAIVIVEEAAEVLEPQLMAALGKSVQHLILIGDHMQLRPSVESFKLRKDFNFDVSMMERLIKNKMPYTSLQMQNRMRPEFAKLLRDIYPNLRDNELRVAKNKKPTCIEKSMFFWDHRDPEEGGRSYWNEEEANRAVKLCLFLLQQGYEPQQVTILGAYLGQTALIRKKIKEAEKKYPNLFPTDSSKEKDDKYKNQCVEVHTIDLYQGDENEIVIVSLVRSNDKNITGFLKLLNRRCVAQSRSRCGLYFIGNSSTVCSVEHWKRMVNQMKVQGCFGPELTIICPKHPDTTKVKVKYADNITLKSFCMIPCKEIMHCNDHRCQQLCQPAHSHDRCTVAVNFRFERCGHISTKQCYKSLSEMKCKEKCPELMVCQIHHCEEICDPIHKHSYCAERVDFTYQQCGHNDTKQCSQTESELPPCKTIVSIYHQICGHLVKKECHQPDEKARCQQPCLKKLTCKHKCPNKCGQPCLDASKCKDCERIAAEEERKRIKMEKMLIKNHQDDVAKELEIIKKSPFPETIRFDLKRDGDTAAEYFSVEDRVRKYIQPTHNWLPDVKRIEKVHNPKQYANYLKVQHNLVDPRDSELLFHGTSADAVDKIIDGGFKLPNNAGMFGKGVYFATDSSKSAQEMYTKNSKMLLLCKVLLGKSKTVKSAKKDMNLYDLRLIEYDSLFAVRDSRNDGGVLFDEYIVYDTRQAIVKYVIHYEEKNLQSTGLTNNLPFLLAPAKYEKHVLKPSRTFNLQNPLDINFRLAEGQFLRLAKERNIGNKSLKAVEYHIQPDLVKRFKLKSAQMRTKYAGTKECDYILAFHGTKPESIDSIVKTNFSLAHLSKSTGDRGWYGAGIYFSEFPDISMGYGNRMLLCMILPGKSYDCLKRMDGAPLQPGYDSHRQGADKQERGQELVIYDPDQILPCYVLDIQ